MQPSWLLICMVPLSLLQLNIFQYPSKQCCISFWFIHCLFLVRHFFASCGSTLQGNITTEVHIEVQTWILLLFTFHKPSIFFPPFYSSTSTGFLWKGDVEWDASYFVTHYWVPWEHPFLRGAQTRKTDGNDIPKLRKKKTHLLSLVLSSL